MRPSFTPSLAVVIAATIGVLLAATPAAAQQFVDGLAQPVFNVSGSNLITHNVWVEIPGLDTDRDGINDRIRVQIRRPAVTEGGTRLPVVLVASPYSGGQLPYPTYNINVPLYEPGKPGHDNYEPPNEPPPPFDPPPAWCRSWRRSTSAAFLPFRCVCPSTRRPPSSARC